MFIREQAPENVRNDNMQRKTRLHVEVRGGRDQSGGGTALDDLLQEAKDRIGQGKEKGIAMKESKGKHRRQRKEKRKWPFG